MGHEPIVKALQEGARLIICGRAYDPSPFAAVTAYYGFPLEYGYHAGKILECAALCAVPGTTKDCMLGTIREDDLSLSRCPVRGNVRRYPLPPILFMKKNIPIYCMGRGWS